ncbi:MAG TPA: glycogen debranching protein GlgX [Nocardioidaceae bacterium]|nr:glycogen debranching protein GlgX [Nocardioidaceae bacterium]
MSPAQWGDGERLDVWPGNPEPRGATWSEEATNFAVFAPLAEAVELCLFADDGEERRLPFTEHTMGVWHGAVPGVAVGTRYGFRAHGPWDPDSGRVFNPAKLLIDPYARAISGRLEHNPAIYGSSGVDSAPYVPLGVVVHDDFDWADDVKPRRRWQKSVIYELHVAGFTKLHDRIPEELRGTYAGLGHPTVTDYLAELGVTAVELLPVHHFLTEPQVAERGMENYWGYNSIGFFAPHGAYARSDRGQQVREFKEMVKAFHAVGIEVILDVVYNHTAEGDADGPTLSMRGLDDRGFYLREGETYAYKDLTGCGNTVDASYPPALRLILDSLRYWATEMRVDGFRFDLASALARLEGDVDAVRSPFVTAVCQDPVLREAKLISEPWDASMDGYLVGAFPAPFCEWNDRYRDTVRDFWRGQASVRDMAYRLAGSSDLYADDGRSPYASINFVTAHDGFTLRDLVSYDEKHNEANGEDNHDGSTHNRSWNSGVEGPTDDVDVLALRHRQAANMLATLLLSTGVPMLTAGDERGRTQQGNNNPYVQDNEISWVDWQPDDAWLDLYDVARTALRLRHAHPALRQRHFFGGLPATHGGPKDLAWMHPSGAEMTDDEWFDPELRTLGMFVSGVPLRQPGSRGERQSDASFLMWFHAGDEPIEVTLPHNAWVEHGEVVLSTDPDHEQGKPVQAGDALTLGARSLLVLRSI